MVALTRKTNSPSTLVKSNLLFLLTIPILLGIPQVTHGQSVAVLTFDNLTGDISNDWIGTGFGETVTNKLKNVSALQTQDRRQVNDLLVANGVDQREVADKNAGEIGKLLGCELLLIGSVQSASDVSNPDAPLLVNARVVDSRTAEILHTLSIKGKMHNLLGLQTALANEFVEKLGVEISAVELQAMAYEETGSLQAYKFCSMGNALLDQGKHREAIELYKLALANHGGIFYAEANHNKVEAFLRLANEDGAAKDSVLTVLVEGEKKKVAELAPIYFNLGQAEELNGNFDKALEAYQTFIDYCDNRLIRWKIETGRAIVSAPAGFKDQIVFASEDDYVYSVDILSGKLRWKNTIAEEPLTTPFIFGGYIFVAGSDGHLYSVKALTGQIAWTKTLTGNPVGSPWISQSALFITSTDGKLHSFNHANGQLNWTAELGPGSPAPVSGTDDVLLAASGSGDLIRFNKSNGTIIWKTRVGGPAVSRAAVSGSSCYVGTQEGEVICLSVETGGIQWQTKFTGAISSQPLVTGKGVFVASDEGDLVCIDSANGEKKWTYKTKGKKLTAPIFHDDLIYVGSDDHNVYAVHSGTGKLSWRYETSKGIHAEPVVLGETVYVGSGDGSLYAINPGEGKSDSRQPTDLDAYLAMGRVAVYQNKIQDAIEIFNYVTRHVKVNVPEAYLELQNLYMQQGDDLKANEMKMKYLNARK